MLRQPDVVGIEEGDEAAFSHIDARIARSTTAAVFLHRKTDARIGEGGHDALGIVLRSVVDDHDLEILAALRQHRADRGR